MPDWRVENAESLRGARLQRLKYRAWSEQWDHDHCAACMAKFAEFEAPDVQHEGYATCSDFVRGAEYEWICLECFAELKDEMGWVEAAPEQADRIARGKRPS